MRKIRIIAYVRVSTAKQADHGNSLAAQKARLESYAQAFELEIVGFEVDMASASTLERPGLQRALAALDEFRAEGLLVAKLDRLTRSVRDLCELVDTYFKDGAHSLLSVGEQIDTRSAAGRMTLNILTVIGQWEREAIGERTSAVMQHMRTKGEYTGGWPPYGWKVGAEGALVEVPEEQLIIAGARRLRAEGCTLRGIALTMPINPRTGKSFSLTQVVRMIDSDRALEAV